MERADDDAMEAAMSDLYSIFLRESERSQVGIPTSERCTAFRDSAST